jgi:hypothetical protein
VIDLLGSDADGQGRAYETLRFLPDDIVANDIEKAPVTREP